MGEWSTGSGGASGPRAAEAGRLFARVDSRMLARLSFPIRPVGPSNVGFLRVVRIPPEANASVNTSRLIVTYLAAERSMPPFLPGSPALPPESR
jgi:hypothetical protein